MSEKQQNQPYKSTVEHKRVSIPNSHGENLVGILHETGSRELVIICHGFRSSKVVRSCTKESEGSFQYGYYRREADDLRDVVKHFQKEQRLIVALIGHSKGVLGGNAVLLYASRYNDIHTIVNIAGRFDLKRGIEGRLGKDFQEKIEQYGFIDVKNRKDTRSACKTIPQSCRVLTVHGTVDEFVPVEDAIEFAKHIPNHNLRIVEGADHEYTKHQSELTSIVLNFVMTDKSVPMPLSSCCRTKNCTDSRL
ncbi:UDP-sulfoquinovose synthase chloroplastic [Phtheirospermum japonicum]|uniref:UDP-sulfoquinovose synthase chloroplastic n=1 Tax=Phtheirospermum japonicum TaxID=374723 RepID=A0A830C182_9LAMI|nr:UDP-sulfoquinovose synthase chloroplastic [Phtheirospermum japonicum]